MLLSVSMSDLQKKYSCSDYTCDRKLRARSAFKTVLLPFPLSFTGSHFAAKTIIIYYKLTLDWV